VIETSSVMLQLASRTTQPAIPPRDTFSLIHLGEPFTNMAHPTYRYVQRPHFPPPSTGPLYPAPTL